jgi:putative hydrolase of the HAD superfamily
VTALDGFDQTMDESVSRHLSTLPPVILLDLDDTILDDSGGAVECWLQICHEAVHGQPEIDLNRLHSAIEVTRGWYWSDAERHRVGRHDLRAASTEIATLALRRLGIDDLSLARQIGNGYRDLRDAQLRPFAGAVEVLHELRRRGVTLGLITNGAAAPQRAKIERFALVAQFDYIGIEGEVGVGKPFPEAYLTALDALGCNAGETWMVGDNLEWDVLAPQRLGIRGVWVNPGRAVPSADVQPDRILGSITDLLDSERTDGIGITHA